MPKRNRAYQDLEGIFLSGVERVNPRGLISAGLQVEGNRLTVESETTSLTLDLNDFDRIIVLGTGKATASMAAGLEEVLGDRISEGLIVVKYGHTETLSRIRSIEAGHPIPAFTRLGSRILNVSSDSSFMSDPLIGRPAISRIVYQVS